MITDVNDAGKRTVAVQYEKHDSIREVKVGKEVILSAGAIGSPQILMLSGVGPRSHLNELGVSIKP